MCIVAARQPVVAALLVTGAVALALPGAVRAQPLTTRASVATDGSEANNFSGRAAVSADGRWVAFSSMASNLVPDDTNGQADIFVHDRQTGTTTRVSFDPGGGQLSIPSDSPAISADGRWIAFHSGSPLGTTQVHLHDRDTSTTILVSPGVGGTLGGGIFPALSADGRWIAYASRASNLVPNDTNLIEDIFVYDRQTATITRVSVGARGTQANGYSWGRPALSADGRLVAFSSIASNLVPDDANGEIDVFVYDREAGATTRVSLGAGAEANGASGSPSISADGRWVTFLSRASNLVVGDTNGHEDVFVHDRLSGATTRISLGPSGVQGNGDSGSPAISADGRFVAFASGASNLVTGDSNGQADVFLHDRYTGLTTRASVGPGGIQGLRGSVLPSISADGRWVSFESDSPNLVADDSNGQWDVFVRDRGDTGCGVTLAPPMASAPAAGTTGRVLVLAAASCGWTAASYDPGWLTVTGGASGTGFGVVDYSVAANPGPFRTGWIAIDGQLFAVEQLDPATPVAPTGLHAHAMAGNLVTLRWTVPPGGPAPTGFVVQGSPYPNDVQAIIPTGDTSPTFTFTAPSGSFYVRVHALNGSSQSGPSNEIRLHVEVPVPPSAPANLLATTHGSTAALAWTNTYEGGAPASLVLEVHGPTVFSIPLGMVDHVTFAGVPNGTYRLTLRARNASGWSPPAGDMILRFPLPCSGPPATPIDLFAHRVGGHPFRPQTVSVDWAPGPTGSAPTGYVLHVSGTMEASFPTAERHLSGTVGPGTYTVSVVAYNDCGVSAASATQTVVVP